MKTISFISAIVLQLFLQINTDTDMKTDKISQSKSIYDIEISSLNGEKIDIIEWTK